MKAPQNVQQTVPEESDDEEDVMEQLYQKYGMEDDEDQLKTAYEKYGEEIDEIDGEEGDQINNEEIEKLMREANQLSADRIQMAN